MIKSCHDFLANSLSANQNASLDLIPRNIFFANTMTPQQSEKKKKKKNLGSRGTRETGVDMAEYGDALTPRIPSYFITLTSFPSLKRDPKRYHVKLVDSEDSFLNEHQCQNQYRLIFRAPEVVLTSRRNLKADIWSLGCTVSHLLCAKSRKCY